MDSAPTDLGQISRNAALIFNPPERMTVTEAAKEYVYLDNSPKYKGPWKPDETPYMVDPQNAIASDFYTAVVFCGSSQTGKTQALLLNGLAYIIKCNPMDVLLFGPSQPAARDFSKRRIDRMHRHSEKLGAEVMPGRDKDNTHDKTYRNGMMVSISWPSLNEMSSKPVPMVMLTEYDRMPDDIDGEGSAFMLSKKRTTSFKSLGMTVAESSPARPVENAQWKPSTPHEAPPCTGILGLYNEGTRHRWYWPCPHCGEYFEGSFSNLTYLTTKKVEGHEEPVDLSDEEIEESVFMACPHNGCMIEPIHKYDMNKRGVWLAEGETITSAGQRGGTPRRSKTASYWLKGPAAAYTTWPELVIALVKAERKYATTGSEEDLKTTFNTDQAEPYIPKANEVNRLPEDIMNTAVPLTAKAVPHDVRALIATIDVQKHRFEVQVMGIRPSGTGTGFDTVVVDRWPLLRSKRFDERVDGYHWVNPHDNPEDWDLLEEQVMEKMYPLFDGTGHMKISLTLCDSGGKEGVTTNAYAFYRRLKKKGNAARFILVKGEHRPGAPRAFLDYPDTKRNDRTARAAGEIPVLFLNTNVLKDAVNSRIGRAIGSAVPGNVAQIGGIVFPDWLDSNFYEELTVETRNLKGQWENKQKRRNESFDLCSYFEGACVYRNVENVNWASPPTWLSPWASNPLVVLMSLPESAPVDKPKGKMQAIADLAGELA